jgi:hypothetical protein
MACVTGLELCGVLDAALSVYGRVTRLCAAHGPRGVRAGASEADLPPHPSDLSTTIMFDAYRQSDTTRRGSNMSDTILDYLQKKFAMWYQPSPGKSSLSNPIYPTPS